MSSGDRAVTYVFCTLFVCITIFAMYFTRQSHNTERTRIAEHYVQMPIYAKDGTRRWLGSVWRREPVEATFRILPSPSEPDTFDMTIR